MSETGSKSAGAFAEAPVSWNTRYISLQGFECQLTLRGTDAGDVLRLAADIMAKMAQSGVRPVGRTDNGHHGADLEPAPAAAQGAAPLCPVHRQPMSRSRFGGWYCAVKIADDDGTGKPVYCKQRKGDGE